MGGRGIGPQARRALGAAVGGALLATLVAATPVAAGAAAADQPPHARTAPAEPAATTAEDEVGDGVGGGVVPVAVRDLDGAPPARPEVGPGPSSSELRRAAGRRGAAEVVVEVHHDGDRGAAEAAVAAAGGALHGPAGDRAVEARVPAAAVAGLERAAHVTYVTTPPLVAPTEGPGQGAEQALTGSEVALAGADDWQAAGIRGAGVRVGIIDSFGSGPWAASAATGDVPGSPAGTFCRWYGTSCAIWGGTSAHGTAVAEVVHEMAPHAGIYIAEVGTTADFQAAIDWFASQGVDVVTRSQTAEYDGPGDGTGAIAEVVSRAADKGMVYLNSAGNSAGGAGRSGSYWRGGWSDTDGDGYLNFSGADELLRTTCWFANGLRWDDWGGSRTDYDVHLYDDRGTLLGSSFDDQQAGAPPVERFNSVPCSSGQTVHVAISLYDAGSGTAGDVLEVMVNGVGLEYWSNPHSATGPMADSADPGMLAVGAVDPAAGTSIASYSSHGPTNDGRTKPDLSAPACVASQAYAPGCFNGTSAATPVVAGAVALAIEARVAATPAGVGAWIRGATVDRGAPGPDNVHGRGQLVLPVGSPAPFASLGALVDRQFRDVVGRPPSAAERTAWIGRLLARTHTRAGLVAFLRTSGENRANVDPVARLYRAYFLRVPDAPGLRYWIARRRAGTSLNQISAHFEGSPEFRARYGALSDAGFVALIYQNILGRAGEPSGMAFWIAELDSGRRSRGRVMTGFSEAPEYVAKQAKTIGVSVVVIQMLRRTPTAAEVADLVAGPATPALLAEWAFTRAEYDAS